MAGLNEPVRNQKSQSSRKNIQNRNTNNSHLIRKRTPKKGPYPENSVYVTKRTNIKAQLEKCEKLFFSKKFNEITIYCMGAAIQQGINLALEFSEQNPSYEISVNTSTVNLTDDLEPLTDEADYETNRRKNSALQIKISNQNKNVL